MRHVWPTRKLIGLSRISLTYGGTEKSIGSWQAQHVLGDVSEYEIGRNGRDLIQTGFAKLTLDIVFRGETESAVGLQANIRGFPRSIGREEFRHVRLRRRARTGPAKNLLIFQLSGKSDYYAISRLICALATRGAFML